MPEAYSIPALSLVLRSQASSSTTRTQRSSVARVPLQAAPLAIVAAAQPPTDVQLPVLIDDVSGLLLIWCPDCKDVRVFAATTTNSEHNIGKRYFKCPRKKFRNVSVLIFMQWPNFILVSSGEA